MGQTKDKALSYGNKQELQDGIRVRAACSSDRDRAMLELFYAVDWLTDITHDYPEIAEWLHRFTVTIQLGQPFEPLFKELVIFMEKFMEVPDNAK